MAKCDVCGKASLLPEKFGEVNICKVCFMKVNGPFWKRQYAKNEDAEKQRCKALETAHKQNFPQPVISAINGFFMEQINAMQKCDACGQTVSALQSLGEARLCNNCHGKICNNEAWKEEDYSDNKEVEENRKKVLKIATKHGFPASVVDGINKHFDSHIQVGLIDTVYGESQELKVFENRCVLETYGNFDDEEMSKRYARLIRKGSHGGLISNNVAKAVVHGVMGGGLVKAGMSLAKSAIVDMAVDAIAPDRTAFKVRKGKVTLDYSIYDIVEFQRVLSIGFEDELGYMRFKCSQQATNDVIFFFTNNYAAEEMYTYICNRIDAIKKKQLEKATRQPKEHTSAADELLKFKQLLDMGAITQEEYDAKKKQLLGL